MVYGLFLSLFFPRAKPLAYKTKLADEGNGKIHLWGQYVCLSSIKISTFSRSINQFSKISRSFFQNIDRGLKLRLNTLSLAHKNLLRIFFSKFLFFQGQKINFENFMVNIFKLPEYEMLRPVVCNFSLVARLLYFKSH